VQLAGASKRRLLTAFAATAALLLLSGADASARSASPARHAFAPDQLLVKFRADTTQAEMASAMRVAHASDKSVIRDLGVHLVNVAPSLLDEALSSLRHSSSVLYAERDEIVQLMDATPNDYWWPNEWSEVKVSGPKAWDLTRGSSSVTVAVLDTGVDPSQPDLQGAFVPGWNTLANNSDTTDTNGHGTLAAGVALARSNNTVGIASYCWNCTLLPVKVMDTNAGNVSSVASGITWAADHGARVISMSFGFTSNSTTLQTAIQYAHSHDVVLAAAAGNYGDNAPVYPAAYPQVLSVAGSDASDQLYSWSSYGSWVKLSAPGCNYATGTNGWYGTFCGTSSAAPVVAGLAGLAASYVPSASNTQIEQALESTASPLGGTVQYGRVDAYRALLSLAATSSGSATGTAPKAYALPSVGGTAQVGQPLTGSAGTWTGSSPMGFAYQWERCDSSGASCAAISGATGASYQLVSTDAGATLRFTVVASNAYGSATATSSPSAVIAAASSPASGGTLTTTFSGTLNGKETTQAFPLSAGTGGIQASLAFSRWSSLTLNMVAADGTVVGTVTGANPLALTKSLPGGSYRLQVTGTGKGGCSFTLTISYPSP